MTPVKRRALARTVRRAGATAASAIAVKTCRNIVGRTHAAERGLDEERAPGHLRGESAFNRCVDLLLHHEPRFACFVGLPTARREQTLGASGDRQRCIGAGLRVGLGDGERSPGDISRNHSVLQSAPGARLGNNEPFRAAHHGGSFALRQVWDASRQLSGSIRY